MNINIYITAQSLELVELEVYRYLTQSPISHCTKL